MPKERRASSQRPANSDGAPARAGSRGGGAGKLAPPREPPAGRVSPQAARLTRELKALCLGMAGVTRDIKWGDHLCFSVGGKMFAIFDVADNLRIAFKADDIEFERLTRKPGIIPAPYAARFGWVQVVEEGALTRKDLERLLARARGLVLEKLPAKKRAAIQSGALP